MKEVVYFGRAQKKAAMVGNFDLLEIDSSRAYNQTMPVVSNYKQHVTRRGSRILKWGVNFCNNVIEPINICGIRRKEGERENKQRLQT